MYKISLITLAALSAIVVMAETPQKEYYDLANAEPLFEEFIKNYDRKYKDEDDKKVHFEAFVKNLKKINEMNKKSTSAVFGINKFADYTEEESKFMHGLKAPERN